MGRQNSEYKTKHIVKLLQKERNSFVRAFDWAERKIEKQNYTFVERDGNNNMDREIETEGVRHTHTQRGRAQR